MDHIYAAMITGLIGQLKVSLETCQGVGQGNDKKAAFDTCVDSLFSVLGQVATLYTSSWSGLEIPWFDHRFDWLRGPRWWVWYERGSAPMQFISPDSKVLDLCSGDGFYPGVFYGQVAALVHGIERNDQAVALARKYYENDCVRFFHQDVLEGDWPLPEYDVIVCMGSIEHFSVADGQKLLERVSQSLSKGGTFIGSTPLVEEISGYKSNPEHDNEFESIERLRDFLSPYFGEIYIWISQWGSRQDVYFECKKKNRAP